MLPTLKNRPTPVWDAQAREVDAALRKSAPELAPATVARWTGSPHVYRGREHPWIVGPYATDPFTQKDGGYPFPREVRAVLTELAARKVDFDDLAIAHELDPAGPVKDLIPSLTADGLACDVAAATHLIGALPASRKTKQVMAGLEKGARTGSLVVAGIAGGVVAGAMAPLLALAAVPALLGELDPIVFGVMHVDQESSGTSLWYPLAAWTW